MTDYSRKMLVEIRKRTSKTVTDLPKTETIVEDTNLNNRFKTLMEEAVKDVKKNSLTEEEQVTNENKNDNCFVVRKTDVQFGNTRRTQEDTIKKTIGDVIFKDDALKYYSKDENLIIEGEINGLDLSFQFKYKDKSGDGCYIWADGFQLSESNAKTVGKIRDCFVIWKQSIVDDGDLMKKLYKEAIKK